MANKRMFSLSVVDTDRFLDMPVSTQALYFHLGMHGDDDGFVSGPRKIARAAGCNDDDLRLLIQKKYIIPFKSGVVVITDWKINNTLKNDRYKPTVYQDELNELTTTPGGSYECGSKLIPEWNQNGTKLEPQHNITEHNLTEHRESVAAKPPTPAQKQGKRFVPPTVEEVGAYCTERRNLIDPQQFVDFYTANGWTQGHGKKIKDWKACVRTWESRDKQRGPAGPAKAMPTADDYDLDRFFGGA
ncbi:MAG: hypothetical protein ACLTWO_05445 [Blautia massiliensis (ex Durand et al. 2017)]